MARRLESPQLFGVRFYLALFMSYLHCSFPRPTHNLIDSFINTYRTWTG